MVGRASFAIVDTMGAVNSAARAAPFFRTAEECASSFRKRDARSLEVVASGASASHGTTSSFIVLDPSLTHFADNRPVSDKGGCLIVQLRYLLARRWTTQRRSSRSTIHDQLRCGDVRGVIRGEKQDCLCNLFRLTPPPKEYPIRNSLRSGFCDVASCLLIRSAGPYRGGRGPRDDDGDSDAARRQIRGEGAGERTNAGFARGVGGIAGLPPCGDDRNVRE